MTQLELLNRIKSEIYQFPQVAKYFFKNPVRYFDNSTSMDWVQLLLITFIAESVIGLVYSLGTLSLGGVIGSIVFDPIKVLVVIALISFVVWLIFDKLGLQRIQFISIYRVIALAEIIVSVYLVLPMVVLFHLKSFYGFFIFSIAGILAKAYFVMRGFDKQLQIKTKTAGAIVGGFLVLFLAPLISDFLDSYKDYEQKRQFEKNYELQTEDAIKEIEKDLGVKLDK